MKKGRTKTQTWVVITVIVVLGAVTIAALALFRNGINTARYGSLDGYGMTGAYSGMLSTGMMSNYTNYSKAAVNGVTMQGC